jgi:perosamine synthetase
MAVSMAGGSGRIGDNERAYVEEVLATGFRASTSATMMKRLEEAFAARFGAKYAISFVNGTATLHAVLEAAGIGPGDEVIVPPLTMSSTTFAVLQANATPVFADVDPETYEIDPRSVADRITPKTRAIMTVALYGLSPDMDPIVELARRRGLIVLEDNAQCFLGTYKGRLAGTIGNAASWSFQASKHITSGEGGMVITDDEELALEVRRVCGLGYASLGAAKGKVTKKDIQDPDYSRHVSMGWNYRMPELCCAVALAHLERIDELVQRRISAARLFAQVVGGCPWLVPQKVGPEYGHSYWTFVARIDRPDLGWREFRDTFASLGGDGIYAAWKLTYLEPMFRNLALRGREKLISRERLAEYREGLCPHAESVQPRLLQFKTNYWRPEEAERQAETLERTIRRLS